jgi:DNA-binding NtrC family response regulator
MSRPTVVVAEDDDDLRELLERLLARDYAVVALEDGFELSDYLELARATVAVPPDLIVSDVCMPGRDGLAALAPRGDWLPRCPVVMISAFADAERRAEARTRGVALFLDKPLDLDELGVAVGRLLEHRT